MSSQPPFDVLREARTAYEGGDTERALSLLASLKLPPDTLADLRNCADLLADLGQIERAIGIYRIAVGKYPDDPLAIFNLASILTKQGKHDEAASAYRQAVALKPDLAAAHFNLALLLQAQGLVEDAIGSYRQTIDLTPTFGPAYSNLALALKSRNALEESLPAFESGIRLQADNARLFHHYGTVLSELGRHSDAEQCFRRVLELEPTALEAWVNLGVALRAQGRPIEAAAALEAALALRPDHAVAWANLGDCRQDLRQFDAAIACYRTATTHRPDYALAYNKLGVALLELRRHDEAVTLFDRAIGLNPDEPTAHLHRANALAELGQSSEAVNGYRRSLEIAPNLALTWANLGIAYRDLGALDDAFFCYDKALEIDPELPAAHWNEALTRLLAGQFGRGLKKYEWRWRRNDAPIPRRALSTPPWLGTSSIDPATILLHAEQGFGDTIQFCRYARILVDHGAKVILDVQPSLKNLMKRSFPDVGVIDSDDALPPFQHHCPLMSLPLARSTDLDTIPAAVPYLQADSSAIMRWRRIVGAKDTKRIGVAWAGSPRHPNDRHRSIPFRQLQPWWALPGITWVSLQKDPPEGDIAELKANPSVTRHGETLADFDETAALISALDLVITVDTAIAHLAGALGKPVWILLPYIPDWRWLLNRSDSPWYPTAHLFRQTVSGDWNIPVDTIATALQHFA